MNVCVYRVIDYYSIPGAGSGFTVTVMKWLLNITESINEHIHPDPQTG